MNITEMKPEEMDQYIKHTIMEQMDSPTFTNTIHQLIDAKVALQLQDLKLKVSQQDRERNCESKKGPHKSGKLLKTLKP